MGDTEQDDDELIGIVKGLRTENARLVKELEEAKAKVESLVVEKFESSEKNDAAALKRRIKALEEDNNRLRDVGAKLMEALKDEKNKVDLLTIQHQKPLPWTKK